MSMKWYLHKLAMMFGAESRRPTKEEETDAAREMKKHQKTPEQAQIRKDLIAHELEYPVVNRKWKYARWTSIIVINVMFIVSFAWDVQLVEGALTASRFLGFHMADPTAAMQVMLAFKEVMLNLLIGTVTVVIIWWFFGGRAFCSWACPYHLLAEWAEAVHLFLAKRGWVKDHPFHRGMRVVLWFVFMGLALVTGYTVFEYINPVGIVSRALIYGPTLAILWVVFLLSIEIFFSRRFWCRYACPMGLTYGVIGTAAPIQIKYELDKCVHEGECRAVCLVPHVLDITKMGYAQDTEEYIAPDCTRCGLCVDACPQGALSFKLRGLDNIL
ncbi:NapH/MauN family ferredoxin-type protein [Aliiroseovarius crassostreae]|uniref:NapH/MauN family ferredoxin-type protein n=1 Tax=Aliiroseovarius crassostreae TaxID=154981 RepID=UPI002203483C|nr:NapH/MauN family ferredoxin-type protein [Aliiroseovarius crassostreae]UWQ07877.1 NapH/MauN family ferredoxin-type protein [Aliiroseovarius crassostreae]UWQ10981.1 NapH/MauN family ferredoxin-type protein [Aliiroseovarius crassostreae]